MVWELPAVKLFPSETDWVEILTPVLELVIVKVPNTKPVVISWAWTTAWLEVMELTIKLVLKV